MERTATVLKDIKSFRDILVHQYGALDEHRAYQNISDGLQDIHDAISDLGIYVD